MVYMVMSYSSSEECTTLIRDNYIQGILQTFEEEEDELDDRTCTENVIKYLDDMCGWVPDPTMQYRRNGSAGRTGKASQKNHGRPGGKPDWGSLARRTGRHEQGPANIDYEFKHHTNLRKYIEQYRRFHTCGGPLEKLSQSAYGRTKTIYYTNESGAKNDRKEKTQSKSAESTERRASSDTRPESQQYLPGIIRNYDEPPPATAPKYHSLTDAMLRKRATLPTNQNVVIGNYTNNGWSNIPPGVVFGEAPPQKNTSSNKDTPMQWTINEHGLTIYQEKSSSVFRHKDNAISGSPLTAYTSSQSSFLPFFNPSQHVMTPGGLQQKRKQLDISTPPPNLPTTNLPVSSGFSIDRTIGSKSCTTGATPNKRKTFKDFYTHLVHAAVNLKLAEHKKKLVYATQESNLHRVMQNKLNLSPKRPNKRTHSSKTRHSTKSNHSNHSRSTCSSCVSRKEKVKDQHKRVSLLQQDSQHSSSTSATSSQSSFSTTPMSASPEVSSRTRPLCSFENIGQFSSGCNRPSVDHDLSGKHVPLRKVVLTDNMSATFHVSLDDHKGKIIAEPDRRLAVCEATWF